MLPVNTNVTIDLKTKAAGTDATAVMITEGSKDAGESGAMLSQAQSDAVTRLLAAGVSRGKAREVHFDLLPQEGGKSGKYARVLVVGIGVAEKVTLESLRQAAGAIARATRKLRLKSVAIVLPQLKGAKGKTPGAAEIAEAVATGLLLASFDFEEFKGTASRKRKTDDGAVDVKRAYTLLADEGSIADARRGAARAQIVCESQNFARTIASRPGNVINPPSLAKIAQDMARELGLKFRVLDEKEMKKLGMGGILGVGAGSNATPPRMIVLEYPGTGGKSAKASSAAPLLVIGKSITFDTGGISIKPADKMQRMIFDKCGGMAVLGLMSAVARLKLPVRIVGILAAAENHISETAYRPGDILHMYNGVTVEVTNTDAEGRLVLGDALAWGIETYKPRAVVNLATLTGGVVIALGKTMAGVMSNSDELVQELADAAALTGEKFWRLPVWDEHREMMRSDPADILNSAGREASPLAGGAFLSYFVPWDREKDKNFVPWAHIDIAGCADTEKELPYYARGATGWGVRTLVEWATAAAENDRRGK